LVRPCFRSVELECELSLAERGEAITRASKVTERKSMVQVNIVVLEIGKLKPDFSLDFELPEVPAVGSYISILRPDTPEPYGEDLVVRKIWWRLKHPETRDSEASPAKIGSFHEIFVECNQAAGPYSSESWLSLLDSAKKRGVEIEEMRVSRLSAPESEIRKELDDRGPDSSNVVAFDTPKAGEGSG
jgi:hypothetical protein